MGMALHEAVVGDHYGIMNDLLERGACVVNGICPCQAQTHAPLFAMARLGPAPAFPPAPPRADRSPPPDEEDLLPPCSPPSPPPPSISSSSPAAEAAVPGAPAFEEDPPVVSERCRPP